jgi:hypothetical protein
MQAVSKPAGRRAGATAARGSSCRRRRRPGVSRRGLTHAELRASSPRPGVLLAVLSDELRRGRVKCEAGRWALVPGAFPVDLLEALRAFT